VRDRLAFDEGGEIGRADRHKAVGGGQRHVMFLSGCPGALRTSRAVPGAGRSAAGSAR
jgi:hypothetical protein